MAPLAEFLKVLRLEYSQSQTEFGSHMGLAGSHVCIVENGLRYAPEFKSIEPLISALNLSREDRAMLESCAKESPRKLRIPPDSPPSAFRLIAALENRWPEFTEADFTQLHHHVQSFSRSRVGRGEL